MTVNHDAALDELDAHLNEILQRPYERAAIEQRIEENFSQENAVMVLDMAGFSRITREHGVVPYLLTIHQTRLLAIPIVEQTAGTVVEAMADDLHCIFPTVQASIDAGREILRALKTANVVLPSDFKLLRIDRDRLGRALHITHDRVAGDQVNLAAKLGEDVADHGEILLTAEACTELGGDMALEKRRTNLAELEFDCFALTT